MKYTNRNPNNSSYQIKIVECQLIIDKRHENRVLKLCPETLAFRLI